MLGGYEEIEFIRATKLSRDFLSMVRCDCVTYGKFDSWNQDVIVNAAASVCVTVVHNVHRYGLIISSQRKQLEH